MPHVYSTLSNDNIYTKWEKGGGDMNVLRAHNKVLIKGGTNVANDRLITPMGVHTQITDAQLAICEADPVFQVHKENGFITVGTKKTDPEKVAANMANRDGSAPIVPQDYQDGDRAKPAMLKA